MTRTFIFRSAILSTAAWLMATPALAQGPQPADSGGAGTGQTSSDDTRDELVVTAQRQAYRGDVPIQDLPQSVSVLSGEMLTDVGITRLDTALDLTSGVNRQNNFGGIWDSFAIRGFA